MVESVIKKIETKIGPMSKTFGDKHDFLGMDIRYEKGKVKIGMKKHIKKVIDLFIDDITRDAATPARPDLFDVPESELLEAERAENFHSMTALLLFISRRCRFDI